jgi:hypothetical protein
MTKDNGLSGAPILVIDFDMLRVFLTGRYVWHGDFPFLLMGSLSSTQVAGIRHITCAVFLEF